MADDRYNRWQGLGIAQLSVAVALISGLSVAGLGVGLVLLQNKEFLLSAPFKGYRGSYGGIAMIANDQELKVTLDRIAQFQAQVAHLRNTETNPANYRAAVSGFLTEIDRMQLEVREYLSLHPRELPTAV